MWQIESVLISKEAPLWIVNLKRGLATQLQLQLDGTSGVFGEEARAGYYADNAVYHAMEGGAGGECRTWYHINKVSDQQLEAEPELLTEPDLCADENDVYEIVKNRDFDQCRVLPLYNYVSIQGIDCDPSNGAGCQNKFSVRWPLVCCRRNAFHFVLFFFYLLLLFFFFSSSTST